MGSFLVVDVSWQPRFVDLSFAELSYQYRRPDRKIVRRFLRCENFCQAVRRLGVVIRVTFFPCYGSPQPLSVSWRSSPNGSIILMDLNYVSTCDPLTRSTRIRTSLIDLA